MSDQERKEFDAWCQQSAIRADLGAWEAWQARAALAQQAESPQEPLTDEQIGELARPGYNGFAQQVLYDFRAFARAIERTLATRWGVKLKES